jgi:Holliday junction DNA helicase RuvA
MIARIRGRLLDKKPNQVIVDVQGVGYEVNIPVSTYYQLPEPPAETELAIHTHVREDALSLYGFRTAHEKLVFEKLISVSGIGPKLAVTILSGLEVSELVPAIRQNDVVKLTHIPGVGRKTAERMVVELRDKLGALDPAQVAEPPLPGLSAVETDVLSALVNLGYARSVAEKAMQKVDGRPAMAFDGLLRATLQALVK